MALTYCKLPFQARACKIMAPDCDVHLKILPGAQLPFTTLRLRVRERGLIAGLREGSSVKFRGERIEGESTLVTLRAVPPCVRFQPCD